ncbi:transketolase family protein [Fretibacterium sp. OH1220_COT-178]|uniref:transketolase family protein n=1 Tax=Fretibacterium sp. OH1220_COT-178 TaxID=2491047 RepID=UPI000F5DF6E0|nr:transketolase C-terminal domain-containing protein [Fretibacterium sp. OH1220_COT-178]RRD65828.1 transketolase [Fretibacterium sp. OH1220_COT-178]
MKDAEASGMDCNAVLREAFKGEEEFAGLALLGSGAGEEDADGPGAAEQSLVLMAAGMACGGKRVVVSACSSLLIGRAYEQIRSAIALPSLPVCLVGRDSGFGAGYAGGARQMFEDVALMRSLPNMKLLVPADGRSAVTLLREAVRQGGPSYVRLGAEGGEPCSAEEPRLRLGGMRVLRQGTDITLCAYGIMVGEALRAADVLAQQEIQAEVIDCYSLAPFPARPLLSSLQRTGCCVTAEEHFLPGGLFETVAGLAAREYPVPVQPVAVRSGFGQSGAPQDLKGYYGLTAAQIVSAAVLAWTRRRR